MQILHRVIFCITVVFFSRHNGSYESRLVLIGDLSIWPEWLKLGVETTPERNDKLKEKRKGNILWMCTEYSGLVLTGVGDAELLTVSPFEHCIQ